MQKYFYYFRLCQIGHSVLKNPPAVQETQVPSLDQEDSLKEAVATHSSILAWRIPWTKEPSGLQSMGLQKSQRTHSTKKMKPILSLFPPFPPPFNLYSLLYILCVVLYLVAHSCLTLWKGNGSLLLLLAISRITLLQSLVLQNYIFD